MTFFEIGNATVWRGDTAALTDFSLELRTGESIAVLGPNGAGKSTFLKLLTGEACPEADPQSSCRLFGEDLWSLEDLRHRIGIVMPEEVARFNNHELGLDLVLSSLRGAYGCTPRMRFSKPDRSRAEAAMEIMGVAQLAAREFGGLSSGERRRLLIARALVHEPEILVLDEPSTALDFSASLHLISTLRQLLNHGRTLVWVTHHPGEIPPEIDRVVLLKDGKVFADGKKREVLTKRVLADLYEIPLHVGWSRGWCNVRFQ